MIIIIIIITIIILIMIIIQDHSKGYAQSKVLMFVLMVERNRSL